MRIAVIGGGVGAAVAYPVALLVKQAPGNHLFVTTMPLSSDAVNVRLCFTRTS